MNIIIGKNLKRLRKSKEITQEELAEYLDISFQSVSKWERGESYPDIMMLPGIANYFDVSVDELLGMDEIRNKMTLDDVFKQANEYRKKDQNNEAISLLRDALKYYPNNYSLMSELALALSNKGCNTENDIESIREAIVLCKRVFDNCKNEKVKSTSVSNLCYLYRMVGEDENAIAVARALPHIWESREMIWPDMLNGQERTEKLKKSIFTTLSVIYGKIKAANSDEKCVPKMITSGPEEYEEKEMLNCIIEFIQ